ncbi:SspB family protein [Segnochrobactrum spirostomi]|uniref:Stringent starvation protein B n=1 Tax=Segnochrobactrum spirostomi TaxID=2608987 RepID=A0A6A7Y0Q6_9HYPH|nr:SspB family protein [Segnochrobactrum spirostomi]MQT11529.1 hypothetical protein [Segnochrobactrum spirostomi]
MREDLIRYDVLVQEALRGVVKKVLVEASHAGLPGEHHFFIAFNTTAPGVRISSRLRQKYPEEMTVVLQHQFWELNVSDTAFEVGLSFGGVPEKLYIPFNAVKGFFDPSVQFGLQFDPEHDRGAEAEQPVAGPTPLPARAVEPAAAPEQAASPAAAAEASDKPTAKPDAAPGENAGAAVVSLDAFRRKP